MRCDFCHSEGECYEWCECAKCVDSEDYDKWKCENPEEFDEWIEKKQEEEDEDFEIESYYR